ncbi:hypothetical protein [Geminisphaera colitermitum]|uniref:hypothetical protein n=1 Tax=Geminisphaera colitermitum TaxID=1148786 RepID=UPI0012FE8B04|nr:hypothetical protein [Geminisphaera colitermitum]
MAARSGGILPPVGASLATERASAEMAHLQGAIWSEAQDQTGTVCKPANLQVCSVRRAQAFRPHSDVAQASRLPSCL